MLVAVAVRIWGAGRGQSLESGVAIAATRQHQCVNQRSKRTGLFAVDQQQGRALDVQRQRSIDIEVDELLRRRSIHTLLQLRRFDKRLQGLVDGGRRFSPCCKQGTGGFKVFGVALQTQCGFGADAARAVFAFARDAGVAETIEGEMAALYGEQSLWDRLHDLADGGVQHRAMRAQRICPLSDVHRCFGIAENQVPRGAHDHCLGLAVLQQQITQGLGILSVEAGDETFEEFVTGDVARGRAIKKLGII